MLSCWMLPAHTMGLRRPRFGRAGTEREREAETETEEQVEEKDEVKEVSFESLRGTGGK